MWCRVIVSFGMFFTLQYPNITASVPLIPSIFMPSIRSVGSSGGEVEMSLVYDFLVRLLTGLRAVTELLIAAAALETANEIFNLVAVRAPGRAN
jgi:hypothetical protein